MPTSAYASYLDKLFAAAASAAIFYFCVTQVWGSLQGCGPVQEVQQDHI
jgi:hypothetical protein